MKKTYKLDGLCCANCAAQMERGINRLEGVRSAVLSFMTQRLTIDAEDARFDTVLREAETLIRKIEPGCSLLR